MNCTTVLDPEFNMAIKAIAEDILPRGFIVKYTGAPDTHKAVVAEFCKYGMPVVDGNNSNETIYGYADVNHAFRAWHDWHHVINADAGFDRAGEILVLGAQLQDLYEWLAKNEKYQSKTLIWSAYLIAEILGQFDFKEHTGEFPVDQRAFVLGYINENMAK